jgi:hypothetical protein
MLAPDARAVLLDQLRPPIGYAMNAAVATTFTLDLPAALIPPLAFASFTLSGTPDPVAALEAVRACADRLDVFCQAGQIAVPSQPSDLLAFLEPMVHEVHRPRPGHLFHPKVWLLRYCNPDDVDRYRLLCLTRNLTNDHSWDVALRLDGVLGSRPKATNRPLAELVRALPGLTTTPVPQERRDRVFSLAADARRLVWEHPNDVNEISFHAYGIRGAPPSADFSGYRHLVIAPFLTDDGLAMVTRDSPDVSVVSRAEDLDRLRPETVSAITPYVVSSIAGLDEEGAGGSSADQQILAGLHAKLYVAERGRRAHVFLGSANATRAALTGNVEFLVELVGGATRLGVATFLGPDAPFRSLLEQYATAGGAAPDPADEARRKLDDLLRDVAAVPHIVTVHAGSAEYALAVTTERALPARDGYKLTMELLTRPGDAQSLTATPVSATFGPVPVADVTPFLVVRATSPEGLQGGTVIRGSLVNDPAGRLDEVLARQVNTPDKFLRFLALLLGLGNPHLLAMLTASGTSEVGYASVGPAPGVFELILRALADRPQALADLDRLVRRLQATEVGRAVLPDGFAALWQVVEQAQRQLEKAAPG